ncbi:MAG TPA: ECF transporter S component [Epulopiscium sp.]|nr:ECF transporter S component [Candidatus Epulonipiscium sp.]
MENEKNKLFSTQNLMRMGLLSAISVLLMQFDFSVPGLFPPFLKVDLGEVPAIVGILVVHPLAGLVIPFIKILIDSLIFQSTTGYVGEASNLIISIAYLMPLMIITNKNKSFKATVVGLTLGIVTTTIVGCISNYFIILPLYAKIFMPLDVIIGMGAKVNSAITDMKSFVYLIIAPFNIFKSTIVSIASVTIVKAILPVMKMLRSKQA